MSWIPSLPLASLLLASSLAACAGSDANAPPADAAPADAAPADVAPDASLDADVASPDAPPADAPRDAGVDEAFVVAPHDPVIQVPNQGGPIIAHPRLVLVTYADEPNREALEAHARWLVASPWMHAVGDEYGVGEGSVVGVVHLPEAAPDAISDRQIATMLAAGVHDGTLPRAADGTLDGVVYITYFPQHTVVTQSASGASQRSCASFGGYHYEVTSEPGVRFAYAVIPTCPVPRALASLTMLEVEEMTVAHEVIEAATDPFPRTDPAWGLTAESASPWLYIGNEVADLCSLSLHLYREGAFVAERSYSNAAALLGDRDPCVPADPARPFFTFAISPDTAQAAAPGETVEFTLRGWSTAPVPGWDVGSTTAGAFTPTVAFSTPRADNGTTLTMRVTVPASAPLHSRALVYAYATRGVDDYRIVPAVVFVP